MLDRVYNFKLDRFGDEYATLSWRVLRCMAWPSSKQCVCVCANNKPIHSTTNVKIRGGCVWYFNCFPLYLETSYQSFIRVFHWDGIFIDIFFIKHSAINELLAIEYYALKIIYKCWNIKISFYSETSGGQSFYLHLNVVYFRNNIFH